MTARWKARHLPTVENPRAIPGQWWYLEDGDVTHGVAHRCLSRFSEPDSRFWGAVWSASGEVLHERRFRRSKAARAWVERTVASLPAGSTGYDARWITRASIRIREIESEIDALNLRTEEAMSIL